MIGSSSIVARSRSHPPSGGVEPADGEPVFLAAKRDGEALRFGFQRNGINGHYPIPALSMDWRFACFCPLFAVPPVFPAFLCLEREGRKPSAS